MRALAVALAIALAFLALRPISSPDFWWHLSMGRATAEAGSSVYEDPVATASETRYVNIVWLFDLPLYSIYRAGGLVAVNLVVAAFAALSFLLCWAVARDALVRQAPWTALAVAALAAGGAHIRFAPDLRPSS